MCVDGAGEKRDNLSVEIVSLDQREKGRTLQLGSGDEQDGTLGDERSGSVGEHVGGGALAGVVVEVHAIWRARVEVHRMVLRGLCEGAREEPDDGEGGRLLVRKSAEQSEQRERGRWGSYGPFRDGYCGAQLAGEETIRELRGELGARAGAVRCRGRAARAWRCACSRGAPVAPGPSERNGASLEIRPRLCPLDCRIGCSSPHRARAR